jgi:hypothetical protein
MLFSTITTALLFAASATAAALPLPGKPQTYTPARNLKSLAKLFPQSTLASPDSLGLDLKYVVLGIGTQNYTCSKPDDSVAPGTTGAYGKNSLSSTAGHA